MYEYTGVYKLASDGAVCDTYQKKNYSHFQSGDVSHATTVGYEALQSESRLLLCCAPVTRDTRTRRQYDTRYALPGNNIGHGMTLHTRVTRVQ